MLDDAGIAVHFYITPLHHPGGEASPVAWDV